MSEALEHNSSLNKLHLTNNYIKEEGLRYLLEAIKKNCTLKYFKLLGNPF
jgi:hypothetical protein